MRVVDTCKARACLQNLHTHMLIKSPIVGVLLPGKNSPLSLGEVPSELEVNTSLSEHCLLRGGTEGGWERGTGGVAFTILWKPKYSTNISSKHTGN